MNDAKQVYAGQAIAQNYPATTAAVPQLVSESIISRLNSIRMNLADMRSSLGNAADKIVGSAPTLLEQAGQIKGEHPPACCFIDALQQVIGDIENIGADLHDHLGRLHRSF